MMRPRAHRTPWSIWIIAAIWSLAGIAPLFRLGASVLSEPGPAVVAGLLLGVALAAYQAIALVRLSRWPLLLTAVSAAWSLIARHLAHFEWRDEYPMLGVFVTLIPLTLYFACTLPHWRKMNWGLFGRPYRPAEDAVEVFT